MSKRALKAYLNELSKKQLQEQILDLYTRFKPIKTYYNFVFNPKEEQLLDDARFKISKEYFPVNTRKPKLRRSVAQKMIKHYLQLGVDPYVIAEVMLLNIEVAQKYTQGKEIKAGSFYTSMLKSFEELVQHLHIHGLTEDFKARTANLLKKANDQHWPNSYAFEDALQE